MTPRQSSHSRLQEMADHSMREACSRWGRRRPLSTLHSLWKVSVVEQRRHAQFAARGES